MDAIAITPQVAVPAPTTSVLPTQGPTPSTPALPPLGNMSGQPQFDPQAAEQKRMESAQQMAQQYVANFYPVGSLVFTMFKDSTGQLITRFRSLLDGKVTYVPEPTLFKQKTSPEVPSLLNISA